MVESPEHQKSRPVGGTTSTWITRALRNRDDGGFDAHHRPFNPAIARSSIRAAPFDEIDDGDNSPKRRAIGSEMGTNLCMIMCTFGGRSLNPGDCRKVQGITLGI